MGLKSIYIRISCHNGKTVPAHNMNAYRGNRGTDPLIPNIGSRWRWSTARPGRFIPDQEPKHLLNTRLSRRSHSGKFWWRNLWPLAVYLEILRRLHIMHLCYCLHYRESWVTEPKRHQDARVLGHKLTFSVVIPPCRGPHPPALSDMAQARQY